MQHQQVHQDCPLDYSRALIKRVGAHYRDRLHINHASQIQRVRRLQYVWR